MVKICIENLELHAFHGYYDEERKAGGKFTVDLSFSADFSAAAATDNLSHTINYQEVTALIKREMEIPSKLLEHVAGRIIKALKKEFPGISDIALKISKHHPPVPEKVEKISVVVKDNDR